ncbi:Hypothetical predicted protein [Marmota monax]|uniref:Uncharacterized protein n=1 Tax=Marmota monax TaxID=9995 RepID=A0A5E4A256_MARMO|nr:Hypothetical predicted protein [Marmota monax]
MTPEEMETQGPLQRHAGHRGPSSPFKQKPSIHARPGLPEPQPLSPAEPPPCPLPTAGSSVLEPREHPHCPPAAPPWERNNRPLESAGGQRPPAGNLQVHLRLAAACGRALAGGESPPAPSTCPEEAKPEQAGLVLSRAHGAGDVAGVQSMQGRGSQTALTPSASRLCPSHLGASSPSRPPPAPADLTPRPCACTLASPFSPGCCPLAPSTLRLHLGLPLGSQSPPWRVPPAPTPREAVCACLASGSRGTRKTEFIIWPPYFPFFSSSCLRME